MVNFDKLTRDMKDANSSDTRSVTDADIDVLANMLRNDSAGEHLIYPEHNVFRDAAEVIKNRLEVDGTLYSTSLNVTLDRIMFAIDNVGDSISSAEDIPEFMFYQDYTGYLQDLFLKAYGKQKTAVEILRESAGEIIKHGNAGYIIDFSPSTHRGGDLDDAMKGYREYHGIDPVDAAKNFRNLVKGVLDDDRNRPFETITLYSTDAIWDDAFFADPAPHNMIEVRFGDKLCVTAAVPNSYGQVNCIPDEEVDEIIAR